MEILKLSKILYCIFNFYLIISLALEIEKSGWATNRCRKIVFKGYKGKKEKISVVQKNTILTESYQIH